MQPNNIDNNDNAQDMNENCATQNKEVDKKTKIFNFIKNKSGALTVAIAIGTGIAALSLLVPFTSTLIKKVSSAVQKTEEIINHTFVFAEENKPQTLLEKYQFYKEINNVSQWDYEKYFQPVLQRAQESSIDNCDNYHAIISCLVPINSGDLLLSNNAKIDVDGNVAHGFIDVVFYDQNVREYDYETDQTSGEYYKSTVEFYRILENDMVTTYMSLDGENWFAKDGFTFNQGNVFFDLEAFVNKLDAKDASWFPTYVGDAISLDILETLYRSLMMNSDALYYRCDDWGETNLYIYRDSYLPYRVAASSASVNENKLQKLFEDANDPLLKRLCKSELTMWPVYTFEQYGEVSIEIPESLLTARHVDNFYELFTDLYDAIDQYALKSDWRE